MAAGAVFSWAANGTGFQYWVSTPPAWESAPFCGSQGAFAAYPRREEHPAPVFHGPLDSLAILRMYIVPITGN